MNIDGVSTPKGGSSRPRAEQPGVSQGKGSRLYGKEATLPLPREVFTMARRIVGSLLVLALGLVGSMGMALAGDDRGVHRSGHGTLGSPWRLEPQDEGARIEVDFEVRTPASHQAWTVALKDDGNVFFRGTRATESDGDWTWNGTSPTTPVVTESLLRQSAR